MTHKPTHTAAQHSALIADIGGTNVRFALTDAGGRFHHVAAFASADYPDFLSAARAYLNTAPARIPARRGAFAIACPVTGERVRMTNMDWTFSIDELRRQLGFDSLDVINDFAAIALAAPHLSSEDRRQVGGGAARGGAPIGVVGPGTGLGVSALIPADGGGIALETEGGHVTLAAADEQEARVIGALRQRFGHVSAERTLSGPGLVNLYQTVAALDGAAVEPLTPEQVSTQGLASPASPCGKAVEMFCAMLGTVAADLALSLGARGGIYIAGGIVAKLGDAFVRSGFRQRFEAKGRFCAYLADIPTYVITHPYPALLGLSDILDRETLPQALPRPEPKPS